MKRMLKDYGIAITCAAIFCGMWASKATDFAVGQSANTIPMTFLGPTTSNKTSAAQNLESVTMHTFQIVTLCTNAVSNIISGSLNATNWVPLATNSVSASATNAVTINQRWTWVQVNFTQTTANGSTNTVSYLGGRQ